MILDILLNILRKKQKMTTETAIFTLKEYIDNNRPFLQFPWQYRAPQYHWSLQEEARVIIHATYCKRSIQLYRRLHAFLLAVRAASYPHCSDLGSAGVFQ